MGRVRKDQKDLPPPTNRAKDEMNLAEFPFCQLSDKTTDTKVLAFSYDSVQEDGTIIRREWRVEGGAECGLPRPIDEDVYVGLMLLTSRQGFESQKITFTIYELLEVLGWDKSGKSYSRIRASLRRLRNLSIEAVNAFKDNQTKRYEKYLGFGIIDDYEISTGTSLDNTLAFDDTEVPAGKSYIRWNVRLFKSFKDGYIKNLDHEFYRTLKSTISKRLYRFLDKKFYFGPEITIDVIQLGYEHIGLSRQSAYPSKVWEKLAGGVKELISKNYLTIAERQGKTARFVRAQGAVTYADSISETPSPGVEPKEATPIDILTKRLIDSMNSFGINGGQIKKFVKNRKEAQLQQAIDIIDYFKQVILPRAKDRMDNPAGYLITLLKDESFELPSHFISERRRSNINDSRSENTYPTIDQLLKEIQYHQRLEMIGESEFRKLAVKEQEHQISLRITEMMLSEHRTTYQSWPKDLLREHAIYQVKKDLVNQVDTARV